jgi:dTDP-4-dehydrorhamnose reductase
MNIVVLGSNSLLASLIMPSLRNSLGHDDIIEITTSSKISDLSVLENLKKVIKETKPHLIINLTAMTNVDFCQSNAVLAYNSNSKICQNLSIISQSLSSEEKFKIIHISTDHLYHSPNNAESAEENVTPFNIYAYSKLLGEQYISEVQGTLILRTNFFGKSNIPRLSFTDWLFQSASNNNEISLFNDVYFNPISSSSLANLLSECIKKNIAGVYNLGTNDGMSKADFAINFFSNMGLTYKNYKLIDYKDSKLTTPRPLNMKMSVQKIEKALGKKMPSLKTEIQNIAKDYKVKNDTQLKS